MPDGFAAQAARPPAREFLSLTSLTIWHNPGAFAFRGSRITRLRLVISKFYPEVTELPDLFRSCVSLEELEVSNEGALEGGLRLFPGEAIPLPHLRSFSQTLHCDGQRPGILNSLCLPPSGSVVLRCIAGVTRGFPPLSPPDLRDMSYLTNLKRAKAVAGGISGGKEGITLDLINNKGTRFTAITEFFDCTSGLPSDERTKDREVGFSMSAVEVLCIGGHRYVSLGSDTGCLTTLILSGPVHLYVEFLAESKHPTACKNLHTLRLFVARSQFTSDLARRLLTIAQTRAKLGLPLRVITFAYPSTLAKNELTVLEGLRECVERVELLFGGDALGWNLDKYFLNAQSVSRQP